jgi:HTH-type transcriptional regulator / antitoxin HipB
MIRGIRTYVRFLLLEPAMTDRFANAIRLRRHRLGLRQDELADLSGVSERFIYALENGKRTVQLDKVLAVLSALGLHLELHRGGAPEIGADVDRVAR